MLSYVNPIRLKKSLFKVSNIQGFKPVVISKYAKALAFIHQNNINYCFLKCNFPV